MKLSVESKSENSISIEGTILMLDDATPHVAVVVQAVIPTNDEPMVAATALSDEKGVYRLVNLEPGHYQVRCHVPGKYIYYGQKADTSDGAILTVKQGKTLKNIDFRFPPIKKGTWRHYSRMDGLAQSAVNKIYIGDGFMWLGTDGGGISRFDGNEFVNFTHEDGLPMAPAIWSIHRDPDGMMWFGIFPSAVCCYDGKGFIRVDRGNELANSLNVMCINQDTSGAMWFGTYKGIYRYHRGDFANFTTEDGLVGNIVSIIHQGADGKMWFFTEKGVSRYDGRDFTNFSYEETLTKHHSEFTNLTDKHTMELHRDTNGGIWCAPRILLTARHRTPSDVGGGVFGYSEDGYVHFTTNDGLPHNRVDSIQSTSDGMLWFGTWGGGISRYDGGRFVNFVTQDGLLNTAVKYLHVDQDDVIWIASGSMIESYALGGLSRYDPEGFVNFTTRDGLPDNYISMLYRAHDGKLWIGTSKGLVCYDGDGFVNFIAKDSITSNLVTTIQCDKNGILWFGTGTSFVTGAGVLRYDTKTGKFLKPLTMEDGLASNNIRSILADTDGIVWFGTEAGISRFDTNTGKFMETITIKNGLIDNDVRNIISDPDGGIWVESYPAGFVLYDGKEFSKFGYEEGIINMIKAFHHDQGEVVWGAFLFGIARYDGKDLVTFTEKDGVADNMIRPDRYKPIIATSDEIVWFGTEGKGVALYDGVTWSSLDTRDGLAGDRVGSIIKDEDGSLWFGTNNGITHYRRTKSRPKAYIVSVTTDQTYDDLLAIPEFTVGTRITIEYSAIDFKTIPEKRQYRCRIQAFGKSLREKEMDSEWGKPTKSTSFDCTFEEPGTYTFQVRAIDRDLNYSEPAELSLTIQPDPTFVTLTTELDHLRQTVRGKYDFQNIIGRSDGMEKLRVLMERAIDSELTVLITGETGSGKELVAQAIHYSSSRKDRPLLDRNCGAIPKELLASDLFGHRRGAFTGANADRMGLFEAASGGTILLDEIGEMPLDAQIHLLRVLEERKVQRLGENIPRDVDVRIIAMTNRDLREEVKSGGFREDLYYRLSVFPIVIPPLKERPDDIPLLAEYFLLKACTRQNKKIYGFAPSVMDMLVSYPWPGNVRELQNAVELAVALVGEGDRI